MSQPPHLSVVPRLERSANRLLQALAPDDLNLLAELEPVSLKRGYVMIRPNERIEHVYFPVDCIGSVVATTPEGRRIEVGIFGREGMSGTSVLLGSDRSPHECFVQVPGAALRMEADKFTDATRQSPSLHQLLLRYVEAFQVQVAHTALSHGSYTIEERLARWLLMCHDRLDGDDLPARPRVSRVDAWVRRSGVTLALQILEGAGVIHAKRGLITVRDRAKLQEIAGGSYGVPEVEYRRLIGEF
jgi:CRP-like cAMP-binding protein